MEQGFLTPRQLNLVLDKYSKKYRLGDILVETNVIAEEELEVALAHQKQTGLRLGDVLVRLGFVTERQMKEALCKQLRVGWVDLESVAIEQSVSQLISEAYAKRHRVIPINRTEDEVTLAMDDPADLDVIEELRSLTGCGIQVVTSTSTAFEGALERAYGKGQRSRVEAAVAPEPSAGEARSKPATSGSRDPDHATLLERCEAVTEAVRVLAGRCQWVTRALRELQAAYDSMRAESEARGSVAAEALADLHGRCEEATRVLKAVRREREGTIETLRARCNEVFEDRQHVVDTPRNSTLPAEVVAHPSSVPHSRPFR